MDLYLPILVSLVALIVSAITFYLNFLAPFKPLITVGSAVYQFLRVSENAQDLNLTFTDEYDPNKNRILGGVLIPIVFTHNGGKSGVISDVMLRVTREGENDNWLFEPRLNVDERAYLTSFEQNGHLKWMDSTFSPIPISKGSQVKRFILFQWRNNPNFPVGRLRKGRYIVYVLVRVNEGKKFREVDKIIVNFSSEVLGGLGIERYVPSPESIIKERDKLENR
ncbi:MAG: hypothetical protein PVH88_03060 [Ignavibacteria bacterium]